MPGKQSPTEWVNVSNHAVSLDTGQVLAPGEDPVEVDMTKPHNKALRDEGILIRAQTAQTEEKS